MATDTEMPIIPAGITTNSVSFNASSTNINSVFAPLATLATEEMVNTAIEKLDQHVDQLEEDIDYFNNKLKQIDECALTSLDRAEALEIKMDKLESTVEYLKNYINFLEQRIIALEENNR